MTNGDLARCVYDFGTFAYVFGGVFTAYALTKHLIYRWHRFRSGA